MISKNISDFFWCIDSPELILSEHNFFVNDFHKNSFLKRIKQEVASDQLALDSLLEHRLSQLKTRRLGERFELFIKVAFEIHPDYRILTSNLPVRVDNRTLGELDLLVEEISTRKIFHIELACKYYLALPGASDTADYIGPGLADRLDRKLRRLFSHQLTLCQNDDCLLVLKSLLKQNLTSDIESKCILRGRVFNSIACQDQLFVAPINPEAKQGFWGTSELMNDYFIRNNAYVGSMLKNQWFELENISKENLQRDSRTLLKQLARDYSISVAALLNNPSRHQNVMSGDSITMLPKMTQMFIVPDNWLREAINVRQESR